MHQILDQNGNVVKDCPPELGCSAGECIEACQAAAHSRGTVGCDFLIATPAVLPQLKAPCFAAFVTNNWGTAATVTVTRGKQEYSVPSFGRIPDGSGSAVTWPAVPPSGVPAGQVAVLFLSQDPSSDSKLLEKSYPTTCPVTPALNATNGSAVATGETSTGRGTAWRVKTSVPVSVYDILPFGGARTWFPSAEVVLPTSAWGRNFIAVVPPESPERVYPRWGQALAVEEGTTITISPSVDLPAGPGVTAAPANAPTSYTLSSGEYIQWMDSREMTGSVLQSDKPISLMSGGHLCAQSATSEGGGCEGAHQPVPPIQALGSEYAVAPFATRRADLQPESIPYRIAGVVNGTLLSYDPPQPAAPSKLEAGGYADFESTQPFVIKSQDVDHPFYLAQLMPGCHVTGGTRPGDMPLKDPEQAPCLGDEEYVVLLPPAQFLRRYVFFTDPTFPTTNLVLVRTRTPSGFEDVELNCLGTVSGWSPLGGSGRYELAHVDLLRGGQPNGNCTNGPQSARSKGDFGIMVWGLDTYASYAYPAGGTFSPINTVVVPTVR